MADEGGDGSQTHGTVTDKVVPQDPKKRKFVAIGIGLLGIVVAYLIYRRGQSGNSSAPITGANGQIVSAGGAGGVTADVAVPSGDVSPSDLLAQFANTIAADQAQLNTMWGNQLAAVSKDSHVTVNVNGDTSQPGGPPATTHPTTPAPSSGGTTKVTVLPWNQTGTANALNGHPWQSTLWGIATHYHESWPTVWAANPQIKNPNLIHPGDVITVPTPK